MKRVLSERDQARALLFVAVACGANRVGVFVEGRARYDVHLLFNLGPKLVGPFLAAALIHRAGARVATLAAAVACAMGAVLLAVGLLATGGLLWLAGTSAFTVGSFAFVAELLVPDEDHASPSRFAGMAAFVFARVAVMDLGAMAWSAVPWGLRDGVWNAAGIVLAIVSLLAVVFALPRSKTPSDGAAPAQPVYRAASPMDAAASAAPRPPLEVWPAIRPLVLPAALFAFTSTAVNYRISSGAVSFFGAAASVAGVIYFVKRWRRRELVSLVDWFGRALMVASIGWALTGLGMGFGVLMVPGVAIATVGGTASGLSLGLVALARRGRARYVGVGLACWVTLTTLASYVSDIFYRYGLATLIAAVIAFVVARKLRTRAGELEGWF